MFQNKQLYADKKYILSFIFNPSGKIFPQKEDRWNI